MSNGGPVLGRYTHAPEKAELHVIRLQGLPIALFLRAREHHDDLVRELTLMAIAQAEDATAPALPARLAELVDALGHRYGASASRADIVRDTAMERGDEVVDLAYEVPASAVDDAVALMELMDVADEFCQTEKLLTLPRDPAMVAFSHWYCEEFVRQFNGLPPTRWSGPLA